jgi:hypothetical protein
MSRRPILDCRKAILEVTPNGDILEIAFSGVHGNGVGEELGDYVIETVEADRPAAVVLNFLGFEYVWGNDIGGIVRAFFRRGETPSLRPCGIVAKGRTARSLRSLLELGKLTKTFDITFFEDVDEAVRHLRSRLG